LFLAHRFLSPWWRRRQVPPKRRFLQEPHGVTTQKTPFFRLLIVPAELWLLIRYCGNANPQRVPYPWISVYAWFLRNTSQYVSKEFRTFCLTGQLKTTRSLRTRYTSRHSNKGPSERANHTSLTFSTHINDFKLLLRGNQKEQQTSDIHLQTKHRLAIRLKWAKMSGFHLKPEREPGLRNVVV
jgi:hypothetical protein